MRLFFYYFLRSSWNQIRTFVKTWAFYVFAALFVAGGALWYGFLWYYRRLAAANEDLPTSFEQIVQVTGLSGLNMLELAAGLTILLLLVIQIIGAERSFSTLFRQADVNLLFASDLSPQTVLAFRVTNTLGLAIAATLLLALRLPFLAVQQHLTVYGALSVLLAWCLTLALSVLLKILIYELGSRRSFFHRNLRWLVFALLAAVGYVLYRRYAASQDRDPFRIANEFFNAPWTRWLPVWGWIKGVMLYALEGRWGLSVCLLSLSLALIAGLVLLVRRLPADYYEDTLTSAQETSQLYEAVNAEGAALLVMRSRRRTVTWTGFRHGTGSSVYFFRVFHDRLRSSRFFLSKTMLTYCLAALAGGLYVRYFLDAPIEYIPVLVLAALVFFRTIASPVTEDIRKDTFLLQPEPIWSKLFFSLLGGSCNCALDVFLPLMLGCAAAGFSPLRGLLYLPMLVSVDFFASASGLFTDVSIPNAIGVNPKQVIQVILLYVGLFFDGMVVSYGINFGHPMAGFLLMTVLNVLFGGTFLGLTGVWLYPCGGRPVRSGDAPDEKSARAAYTRVGLAMTLMLLTIRMAQLALSRRGLGELLALYLPIYALGLPVFLLAAGREKAPPGLQDRPLRPGQFLLLIPACFFVMYAGNLLGLALQGLLGSFLGLPRGILQAEPAGGEGNPVIRALLLAFAAPVMEEFVFRRCVLRRLAPYGERGALLVSALLFALFHTSVSQVCYAFLLGLVFGYVYLKTGRLRYSLLLHMLINSMTALLLPVLLERAAEAAYGQSPGEAELAEVLAHPGVLALLGYVALLLVLSLFGAVVFFFGVRERKVSPDGVRLRTVFSSWGVPVFLAVSIAVLLL